MPLKLLTLNIEGNKHLNLVIPFLKKEKADVICLQEVFEKDFSKIKQELGMEGAFFPMCTKSEKGKYVEVPLGIQGVALLAKFPHEKIKGHFYLGKGNAPFFTVPHSADRVLVYTTITYKGKKFTIGTTHFCWTADGKADEQQREAFAALKKFIEKFDDFIICGDFNTPRGGEMFDLFGEFLTDTLPEEVISTLDPARFRVKKLKLVVDTIFSKGAYKVSDVEVKDGVSDHKSVIGYLS